MYPKNAASPERIAIGQVVLIADGTVQTSGVTITVRGQGGAEATGGGTTAYGAEGTVYYTPTQAETNYTSFVVIASKASCFSASQTIITTASATSGKVVLSGETHTSAVIPTVTTLTGHTAQTGDSYAEVTNGTYGLAQLVRASTPANTLNVSITGEVEADVTLISGDSTAAINAESFFDGTGYAGTNNVIPSVTTVTGNVNGSVASVTADVGVNEWNGVPLATTNPLPNAAAGAAGGLPTDSTGKTSFNDLSAAQVNTEVDNSMVTYGLDHLVSVAVIGTDITDNSIIAKLVSSSATADWDTYVNTTDSLQASRDKLTDIETDTAEIGTAGAGLTDLGGMSTAMKAEVNTEATSAITTYDPPTNAEMEARTPTAAQLAYIVANAATGVPVTFTTAGGSPTNAVLNLVDGASASATPDQYNGRLLVFTNSTLKDVVTDITDYDGAGNATITAIPTAPTSTHTARLI